MNRSNFRCTAASAGAAFRCASAGCEHHGGSMLGRHGRRNHRGLNDNRLGGLGRCGCRCVLIHVAKYFAQRGSQRFARGRADGRAGSGSACSVKLWPHRLAATKLPSSTESASERMDFHLNTMLRAGRLVYQSVKALVLTEKRYRICGRKRKALRSFGYSSNYSP